MSFKDALNKIAHIVVEDVPDSSNDAKSKPAPAQQKPNTQTPHPLDDTHLSSAAASSITATIMPDITAEDKERYKSYFDKLFTSLNDAKPSYHEFMAMIDSVNGNSNPSILYPAIFGGFKIQGLTKDVLITTAQNTLSAVQNDAANFNKTMQAKLDTEVEAKRKIVSDKQNQVAQLNSEIEQANSEIVQSEAKIKNNTNIYNGYSQDMISKIQKDITTIDDNIKQ